MEDTILNKDMEQVDDADMELGVVGVVNNYFEDMVVYVCNYWNVEVHSSNYSNAITISDYFHVNYCDDCDFDGDLVLD